MSTTKTITLFEYESVLYSDICISSDCQYLDLIERLNTSNGELVILKRRELHARQYVGLIQIMDLSIEILPKMYNDGSSRASHIEGAQRNLLYLLQYCYDLPSYESEIAYMQTQKANWFEVLTFIFIRSVQDIFTKGILKQYISTEDNLPYLKGKWLIQKDIEINTFKKHLFYVGYDEFSSDIPLNQILKFVIHRLQFQSQNLRNKKALFALDSQMENVSLVSDPAPLLNKVIFTRLNENYRPVFNLAKLFIDGNVVDTSVGSTSAFAFTFDMNRLFERFVARFMKENRHLLLPDQLKNCSIHAQTGRKELARNSDEKKVFWLRPDILMKEDNYIKLIIDTKYKSLKKNTFKTGVSISDMYQMAAYANRYECREIILLYPRTHDDQGAILEEYTLQNSGQKIKIATIDMRMDLLDKSNQKHLISDLKEILKGSENNG